MILLLRAALDAIEVIRRRNHSLPACLHSFCSHLRLGYLGRQAATYASFAMVSNGCRPAVARSF